MLFSLTACGGSKDDDTPIEKPSVVATQAKTEATTSDVIQYDPLEDVEIIFSEFSKYPQKIIMSFHYNLEDKAKESKNA